MDAKHEMSLEGGRYQQEDMIRRRQEMYKHQPRRGKV